MRPLARRLMFALPVALPFMAVAPALRSGRRARGTGDHRRVLSRLDEQLAHIKATAAAEARVVVRIDGRGPEPILPLRRIAERTPSEPDPPDPWADDRAMAWEG